MPQPTDKNTKGDSPKGTGTQRPRAKAAPVKPAAAPAKVKPAAAPPEVKPAAARPEVKPAAAPPKVKPAAAKKATPAPALEPEAVVASSVGNENPLHKKLRLRPEDKGVVIAPPQEADDPLAPLPESFLVLPQAGDLASHEGLFDYIHVFARDRADLIESFTLLRDKLSPGGSLWISWLKQSSTHRSGGQFGDLNENVIRRLGLTHALVDVKVAALDRDWSALRLVHRKR